MEQAFTDVKTAQPTLAEKRMVIVSICDENGDSPRALKAHHFSHYEDHI